MAGYDDDLKTLLEALNRNISRIGGPSTNTTTQRGALGTAAAGLNKAINNMSGSFRLLHGTTDDLAYSIKKMLSYVAGGELLGQIIDVGRHFVRTYNQLSDVGQLFKGSLSEMMSQAGSAGLSLDEYAKSITRNSTLAAVMNVNQETTGRSLIDLQKGVRSTLKEMGFYGMTLSEVTDVVGDSLEMYRQSGVLYKMNAQEQKHAIASLVEDVTAFSQVTGKSRQEILKGIKQIAEDTGASGALALSGKKSVEAYQKWSGSLLAIDPQLAQAYSKAIVTKNIYLTTEGMEMVNANMGNTAAMIQGLVDKTYSGLVPTLDDMSNLGKTLRDEAATHLSQLQGLVGIDPGVSKFITLIGKLNSMPFDEMVKQQKDLDAYLKAHPVDRYLTTFESTFHEMIGAFQSGFYKSLVTSLTGADPNDEEAYTKNIEKTKKDLADFGTSLGDFILSLKPMLIQIKNIFGWFASTLTSIRDFLVGAGIGKGWATLVVAALPVALYKIVKGFMALMFQTAIIKVGRAVIGDAGGVGTGGVPVPGTPATPGTKPVAGGRARRWGGVAGGIGGVVAGEVIYGTLGPIVDSILGQDESTFKSIVDLALQGTLDAGLGMMGRKIIGSIAGGMATSVATAAAGEATAGGLAAMAAGAFTTVGLPALLITALISGAGIALGMWLRNLASSHPDNEFLNPKTGRFSPEGHAQREKMLGGDHPSAMQGWWNRNMPTWLGGTEPTTPLPAQIPFTNRTDIEAMKKRMADDKKRIEEEKAKEDAANPDKNTLLLKDIADTNKEMTELQACVAALVKKNNDLTQEGNRQQANVGQCG